MKIIDYIALTVVIIGGINWGLVGFFDWNLVAFLFGSMTLFSKVIYAVVGLCTLYLFTFYPRINRTAEDTP